MTMACGTPWDAVLNRIYRNLFRPPRPSAQAPWRLLSPLPYPSPWPSLWLWLWGLALPGFSPKKLQIKMVRFEGLLDFIPKNKLQQKHETLWFVVQPPWTEGVFVWHIFWAPPWCPPPEIRAPASLPRASSSLASPRGILRLLGAQQHTWWHAGLQFNRVAPPNLFLNVNIISS